MTLRVLQELSKCEPDPGYEERLAKARQSMEELDRMISKKVRDKHVGQALLNKTVNWGVKY